MLFRSFVHVRLPVHCIFPYTVYHDVTENGLTGERAQAISIELAKQMFPGYQALVVTHTDGHNESGNIHTHIVINSVRKYAVDRQPYMDKPHEEREVTSTDPLINS